MASFIPNSNIAEAEASLANNFATVNPRRRRARGCNVTYSNVKGVDLDFWTDGVEAVERLTLQIFFL